MITDEQVDSISNHFLFSVAPAVANYALQAAKGSCALAALVLLRAARACRAQAKADSIDDPEIWEAFLTAWEATEEEGEAFEKEAGS